MKAISLENQEKIKGIEKVLAFHKAQIEALEVAKEELQKPPSRWNDTFIQELYVSLPKGQSSKTYEAMIEKIKLSLELRAFQEETEGDFSVTSSSGVIYGIGVNCHGRCYVFKTSTTFPGLDPLTVRFLEVDTARAAIEKFGDRLKALFVEVPTPTKGDF